MFSFYTPWKPKKDFWFFCFLGSIKWKHWPEYFNNTENLNKESSLSILVSTDLLEKNDICERFWLFTMEKHVRTIIIIEAVFQRCSVKKLFLKISQNSQGNTCAWVSFLIKLQAVAAKVSSSAFCDI